MRHVLVITGKLKGHGKNRKNVITYSGVHTPVSRVDAGRFLREARGVTIEAAGNETPSGQEGR